MNIFFSRVSSLMGLAALTVICGGLSAQAETTNVATGSSATPLTPQTTEVTAQTEPTNTLTRIASTAVESSPTATPESTAQVIDSQPTNLESPTVSTGDDITTADSINTQQSELIATPSEDAEAVLAPKATTQASAADLIAPSDSQTLESTSEAVDPTVAQIVVPEPEPGRVTRSSPSYIGVGGNFGVIGDSAIGNQSLSIFSKIGLLSFISARPSVLVDFDNDATFLVPLTFDLPTISPLGLSIGPYVGGGLAASVDDGVGGAIIAGIDAPVTPQFTLNAGVNASFVDGADLGVQVGIGYNFFGF